MRRGEMCAQKPTEVITDGRRDGQSNLQNQQSNDQL